MSTLEEELAKKEFMESISIVKGLFAIHQIMDEKGISGGFALAATIVSSELMAKIAKLSSKELKDKDLYETTRELALKAVNFAFDMEKMREHGPTHGTANGVH